MNNDIEIQFRLIANPTKIKKVKSNYKENEYLRLYLNSKFKVNTKTLNNLIKKVENYIDLIIIEDINIEIEIKEVIENIIKKVIQNYE